MPSRSQYDWLPEHAADIKIQNNISSSFDVFLVVSLFLGLVAIFTCGGILVYILCRQEVAEPQEQEGRADHADPNRWIPSIPEVMFKTEAGKRIHLYDGCAGQHGVRRSDNEKYRVCSHCYNKWRNTVDTEVAMYLRRPGHHPRATNGGNTCWTCSCGCRRIKTD